jgi:hypothetical protein
VTTNPDNLLVFGVGRSYGAEFFLRKNTGKLTGWIGYTLAKTERYFENLQTTWFPARYDRTHDLSIAFNYKISDKWTAGAVFVYATGNTMTLPIGWYLHQGDIVFEYGDRNGTRSGHGGCQRRGRAATPGRATGGTRGLVPVLRWIRRGGS